MSRPDSLLRWLRRRGPWLALAMLAGTVQADGRWADCLRDASAAGHIYYQYVEPATVFVGRDSQAGDVMGPWLTAANPVAWRCTPTAALRDAGTVQLSVPGYPPYARDGVIDVDGQTYGVYQTNNLRVAYIARWRYTVNGQATDWQPLTIHTGGQQTPAASVPISYQDGQAFTVGADVQIRFVRRLNEPLPSAVAIFDPMYLRHMQSDGGAVSVGGATYRIAQVRPNSVSLVSGGTCTTPNVLVTLPTVARSAFAGVGSTAAATPFNLAFNHCPAGYRRIGYSFAATTRVLDAGRGVVALSAASTAGGVGLQLAHGDGSPVDFGTVYPLTRYDPQRTGSYTVRMQAALIQTEATVTSGTVRAAVTFTLDYK